MIDILKVFAILYMILLVPFIFGVVWDVYVTRKQLRVETFVRGWILMMALFFCEAVPMILWKVSLSVLKNVWFVTVMAVTMVVVVMFLRGKVHWKLEKSERKKGWKYILVSSILILCSILFLKPDVDDSTVETVMEAYNTDTMYQYQPFTDDKYDNLPKEKVYSPIEMYYAVLANTVNAHPAIVVKLLVPFSFLNVFILVYVMWSRALFFKNKRFRNIFLFFVGCIYFLPIISTNMNLLAVWQNCWKGEVLLGTTVFPLICYDVYRMMASLSEQWKRDKCIQYGVELIVSVIVAQLLYAQGIAFSCIIIISSFMVIAVRRCYEKYVANVK